VVVLELERALPLWSPGYAHIEDEWAMRQFWRERRATLDREFEAHIHRRGPFRAPTA
jgi:hypothetical protein